MKYISLSVYVIIVCFLLLKTIYFTVNHVLITRLDRALLIYQLSSRWGLVVFILHWKRTYDVMLNYDVLIVVITTHKLYLIQENISF